MMIETSLIIPAMELIFNMLCLTYSQYITNGLIACFIPGKVIYF